MVVEPLFQLRTDQAAQDNGDNRGSIAGSRENNRDAEKGGVEAHFKGGTSEYGAKSLTALQGNHGGITQRNS